MPSSGGMSRSSESPVRRGCREDLEGIVQSKEGAFNRQGVPEAEGVRVACEGGGLECGHLGRPCAGKGQARAIPIDAEMAMATARDCPGRMNLLQWAVQESNL